MICLVPNQVLQVLGSDEQCGDHRAQEQDEGPGGGGAPVLFAGDVGPVVHPVEVQLRARWTGRGAVRDRQAMGVGGGEGGDQAK